MSLRSVMISLMVLPLVYSSCAAQAEGRSYDLSFSVTFANQYLWRGFVLNDTPAMQPALSFSYKGFGVSSWANFAYRGPNGQNWTEHDLTVSYSRDVGNWTASGGFIHYHFPDLLEKFQNTFELFGSLQYNGLFSPSFTVYRDVDDGDGWYYYLGFRQGIQAPKGIVVTPSVGVGLNQGQWIEQTTISNFDVGVTVDIPVGRVTFSPFFTQAIGHRTLFGHHSLFGVTMSIQ